MTYISDKRKVERALIPYQFEIELKFILIETKEWRDKLDDGIEKEALSEGIDEISRAYQMMKVEREQYFPGDPRDTPLIRAYGEFFSGPLCSGDNPKNSGGCLQISLFMTQLLIEKYSGAGIQCPVTDEVIDSWYIIKPMLEVGENKRMLAAMENSNRRSAFKILTAMERKDYFSLPRKAA